MAFATPEPADRWLVNRLAVAVGAALPDVTLFVGGWIGPFHIRLVLGVLALFILSFYAYRFLYGVEHFLRVASCALR